MRTIAAIALLAVLLTETGCAYLGGYYMTKNAMRPYPQTSEEAER